MDAYFHSLEPVVIPRAEYIDLEGAGIKEDKRMINAKSPWTLAHLSMKILQGFYNDPSVPPSMKTKLKNAMAMKPSLKGGLVGGLAGVSKASGFIQRMMAENKKKHTGQYKKPTSPGHPDSSMKKWVPFDYNKLAHKDQGGDEVYKNSRGVVERNPYGASPFIQKYFKNGTVPYTRGKVGKESDEQRVIRKALNKKEHFGNVESESEEEEHIDTVESPEPVTRGNPEKNEVVHTSPISKEVEDKCKETYDNFKDMKDSHWIVKDDDWVLQSPEGDEIEGYELGFSSDDVAEANTHIYPPNTWILMKPVMLYEGDFTTPSAEVTVSVDGYDEGETKEKKGRNTVVRYHPRIDTRDIVGNIGLTVWEITRGKATKILSGLENRWLEQLKREYAIGDILEHPSKNKAGLIQKLNEETDPEWSLKIGDVEYFKRPASGGSLRMCGV